MTRPLLLDLFSGAGGAAQGYANAGFDVLGVDIAPQPRYPFRFFERDAMEFLKYRGLFHLDDFDAIHASPPCQSYSRLSNCRPGVAASYPSLIDPVRKLLQASGKPWVMENVAGSGLPEQSDLFGAEGLLLCGAMFGLPSYRHRVFESSVAVPSPNHPRHLTPSARSGHAAQPGEWFSVGGHPAVEPASKALGIDWMTGEELAEAIPPAFTEYIGRALIAELEAAA